MSMPRVREPVIDSPVWTSDGEQFGYIREIRGGYFKVDVPIARDYWLSTSYIDESTLEGVRLTLRKNELDEHRLSAPGVEGEQHNESIISDAEMLAQRERMERELEAQRERMQAGQI